ncbi:MAG: SAM-dependent methyltransferase, partial [Acidobacteriaceae bacterium]
MSRQFDREGGVSRLSRPLLGRQAGIRQFPDIGTGIPTASNTDQVAQSVTPECGVVYVVTTRFRPGR